MRVVCIAGSIASGKTTLARSLATAVRKSVYCAFGDVVRRHATMGVAPPGRRSLQEAGERLIARGWPLFVAETIGQVDASATSLLIVDGVRHVEAFQEIRRQMSDRDVSLVFVQVADDEVSVRVNQRGECPDDLAHHVESEVSLLRQLADVVIDGAVPSDGAVETVLGQIGMGKGASS